MVILKSFQKWRYLWTLPGRKQCTRSSIFPSTITIPNFKPISQTVLEFWKRYHQKTRFREQRGGSKIASFRVVLSNIIIINRFHTIFAKCVVQGFFWGFWSAEWSPATEISAFSLIELQSLCIKNEKNKLWIWIPCETFDVSIEPPENLQLPSYTK